jgi:hypothetical protein
MGRRCHVVAADKRFDERYTKGREEERGETSPQEDSPVLVLFKDGRTNAFIFCDHLRCVR